MHLFQKAIVINYYYNHLATMSLCHKRLLWPTWCLASVTSPLYLPNPLFGNLLSLNYKNLYLSHVQCWVLELCLRGGSRCTWIKNLILINLAIPIWVGDLFPRIFSIRINPLIATKWEALWKWSHTEASVFDDRIKLLNQSWDCLPSDFLLNTQ